MVICYVSSKSIYEQTLSVCNHHLRKKQNEAIKYKQAPDKSNGNPNCRTQVLFKIAIKGLWYNVCLFSML